LSTSVKLDRDCMVPGCETEWCRPTSQSDLGHAPPSCMASRRQTASMNDDLGHARLRGLGPLHVTIGAFPFPTTSHGGESSDSSEEQEEGELKCNQFGRPRLGGLDELAPLDLKGGAWG
jgi:hypothetical protein